MTHWTWALVGFGFGAVTLIVTNGAVSMRLSRTWLTELIKLVPPCLAILRSVVRDPTIPRRHKVTTAIAIACLTPSRSPDP
jgi:hypothetical protein